VPRKRRRKARKAAAPRKARKARKAAKPKTTYKHKGFAYTPGGAAPAANPRRRRRRRRNVASNPSRSRRYYRRRTTRRRRRNQGYRYQIGPVAANSGYRYQIGPVAANYRYGIARKFAANPTAAIMDFPKQIASVEFIKQNVLPFVGGAIGSKIIAAQVAKLVLKDRNYDKYFADAGWKKAGWEAGAGVLGGTAIGVLSKGKYTDLAMKFAAGGIMAGLLTIFETSGQFEKIRGYYEGKKGFGIDIEEELKEKIAQELKTDLQDFVNVQDIVPASQVPSLSGSLSGFVTAEDMPSGPAQITLSDYMSTPSI